MDLEPKLHRRYNYRLLQVGMLPLTPEGKYDRSSEHRSTSLLIWPEGEQPGLDNTILTDPCFTTKGYQDALEQLEQLSLSFLEIGRFFVSHRHRDHLPTLDYFLGRTRLKKFRVGAPKKSLSAIIMIRHPGHSPDMRALVFRSTSNQIICASGDAVLNLQWLKAWKYYWPNGYTTAEIIQTWESVAEILSYADVIMPGHGAPIIVTAALLEELLSTFPSAEYAEECRETVESHLIGRLKKMQTNLPQV